MADIAASRLSIAFSNFLRGYVIVDHRAIMLREPFTAKPCVQFYTTKRLVGEVRDYPSNQTDQVRGELVCIHSRDE